MGITANYKGFRQTILAVQLALEKEDHLQHVMKEIYQEVAKQLGCSRSSVERNLRTVVLAAWRNNPDLLQRLAGRPLSSVPTVSQFIAILATYFKGQEERNQKKALTR